MIPRIIHQIWIGPNPLPAHCAEYVETWKNLHPNWEHKLWTDNDTYDLPPLAQIQADRYHKLNRWAAKADIIRYYLLWKYGGIYADVDFKCFKNIEPLLHKDALLVSPHHDVHWIANSIMGSVAEHPIFDNMMKTFKHESYHGPCYLARIVKEMFNIPFHSKYNDFKDKLNDSGIDFYPAKHFFYNNPKQEHAFARHYPLKSWIRAKDTGRP